MLAHHLRYNWWKYVLILVIGWLAVDFAYAWTRYKVPEDKKIDFYVYGFTNEASLSDYMEKVRVKELPEIEETLVVTMMVDDTYGPMQLTTYLAAHEGDIFLLPREEFLRLSAEGAFIPLENETELMSVLSEADLKRGWRRNTDTGENHLYGIPQSVLPGLLQYVYTSDMNGYLCVLIDNGNEENVIRFLSILCRDMLVPPPESADTESLPE